MMEECGYFVDIIKNMDRERMCMYTHMHRFMFRMEECTCRLLGFLTWWTIWTWVTCYK